MPKTKIKQQANYAARNRRKKEKKICGEIELKSNFNQINGNLTVEATTNQNTIDFHSLIYTRKIEVCCVLNRNVIFQE